MRGELPRERMESHNSFLVHVNDLLAFHKGTLRGIQGPLKVPGSWSEAPPMTPNSIEAHASVIHQMKSRAGAPFTCAVFDAEAPNGGDHMFVRLSSDACHDLPAPRVPHVAGAAPGLHWKFPLTGKWRRRHITLKEALGPAINSLLLGPYFHGMQKVRETDATAAAAAMQDTSRAEDLIYLQRRLREEPIYQAQETSTWDEHVAGFANGVTDCLSRKRL